MTTAASAPSTLTFTDEQQQFIDAIRDFGAREAGTREQRDALTHEGTEQHNQDLYKRFASLGYVGAAIPEEYGGAGGGVVDLCLLLDETTRGLLPMAGMSVSLIVAGAYERFGTETQKQDMLGAIARGDVMAIAMSEPEAGSDVGALKCKAVREGDTYRVTGHKTWISAAHVAERILLICRTDSSGSKHEGITMLEVPANAPGMEIRGIQTMGGKEVNDVWYRRRRRPGREPRRPGGRRLDAAHGRTQRGAPDHRREHARARPARVRRRARLRQGAQAVRPPDRQLPGPASTASPISRWRSSARGC